MKRVIVKGGAFGRLVSELRGEERQEDFAVRLDCSRSLVANIETGWSRPSANFLSRLSELFPEHEAALLQAYNELPPKTSRGKAQRLSPTEVARNRFIRLIERGRTAEAKEGIEFLLRSESDQENRVWLIERLAFLEIQVGNRDAAIERYKEAIEVADAASLPVLASGMRDHLAGILLQQGRFDEGHEIVDAGLRQSFRDSQLWRRKGELHWYAHEYPLAFACLTTGRAFGYFMMARLLHGRGQVLSEWGHYTAAIAELSDVLTRDLSPRDLAFARVSRAHAYAQLGDFSLALKEFAEAEKVTPENGPLHYFRALCYLRQGDQARAVEDLKLALRRAVPALNRLKREHALELLQGL